MSDRAQHPLGPQGGPVAIWKSRSGRTAVLRRQVAHMPVARDDVAVDAEPAPKGPGLGLQFDNNDMYDATVNRAGFGGGSNS